MKGKRIKSTNINQTKLTIFILKNRPFDPFVHNQYSVIQIIKTENCLKTCRQPNFWEKQVHEISLKTETINDDCY